MEWLRKDNNWIFPFLGLLSIKFVVFLSISMIYNSIFILQIGIVIFMISPFLAIALDLIFGEPEARRG